MNAPQRLALFSLLSAALASVNSSIYAAIVPAEATLAQTQRLIINNGAELSSLDPHIGYGQPEASIQRQLLEGLLVSGPDGKMLAGIAERWETADAKTWTFYLRSNATWSNGDPVTADDFVYSWQRLVDPATGSPAADYLKNARIINVEEILQGTKPCSALGVRAKDAHTFEVTLSEPIAYFLKMLSAPMLAPLHKKTVEAHAHTWTTPKTWVGNGAYSLTYWGINDKMVLSRNPAYWDNANTVIDEVTYLTIASEMSEVHRYRAGGLDITSGALPIEQFKMLKKRFREEVVSVPTLGVYYYEFNTKLPPLDDVRIRKALNLALDRNLLVNKLNPQMAKPAHTFVPPYTNGMIPFQHAYSSWSQEQRNNEAKKLLVQAGYDEKRPLRLSLLYNTSDNHRRIAVAAAAIWKRNLGVLITLENQEWKAFLDSRQAGIHQIARAGWLADYNDPSNFFSVFLSNSPSNTSFYNNPQFDALVNQILTCEDEKQRNILYHQAEAYLIEDAPCAPLLFSTSNYLIKPYVGGYPDKNPTIEVYVKDLYILKH